MAAVTWSANGKGDSVVGVATGNAGTVTATDVPTDVEGIYLGDINAVEVAIECATANATINATTGSLLCWRKVSAGWARLKEWDLAMSSAGVTGVRRVSFLGNSAGIGFPVIARRGRVCWVPSAIVVTAGDLNIYIDGCRAGKPM